MVWQERRSSLRHIIELPIRYRILEEKKNVRFPFNGTPSCKTKNISEYGVLFLSSQYFNPGTILELSFPVKDQLFTMKGKVIHSKEDIQPGLFQIGIYFPHADYVFKIKMAEQLHLISQYQQKLSEQEGRIVSEEEAAHRWIEEHSQNFARFF